MKIEFITVRIEREVHHAAKVGAAQKRQLMQDFIKEAIYSHAKAGNDAAASDWQAYAYADKESQPAE